MRKNRRRLREASDAHRARRQMAHLRRQDRRAALGQQAQVRLGGGMLVHVAFHRGDEQQRRGAAQRDGGEHVVGHAMRQPRDGVGGRRRDDQQIGAASQLDMARRRFARRLPQVVIDGTLAERREGERADELARVRRHHHIDKRARLLQLADDIGCLIRRDAPADAEDNALLSNHGNASQPGQCNSHQLPCVRRSGSGSS